MRILLDNCVDHRFARLLPDHEVIHARQLGWAMLSNGTLISSAETFKFEVMITVDKNLRYQQSLSNRKLSIITLNALFVDYRGIEPLAAQVCLALKALPSGSFITIEPEE